EADRARARRPRALPRRAAHRSWTARRARGRPPPPAARALPRGEPRHDLGRSPRGSRGARARHLGGARGADRDQARRPGVRSARRPDPQPRADRAGRREPHPLRARGGRPGNVRARLRLRPGDAALPQRARDRAGRGDRDDRPAALRRPRVGARRRRRARARGSARARDAGERMTPPVEAAVLERPISPRETLLAKGRLRDTLATLRPAFVAAIAYVDPGNFATNVQGGAKFGYLLLWVVLAANLMAMLIQYLSAKLGIVTDRNLPELCREHYPRPVAWGLWIQAEAIAMSTDIAEFLGAALGLNLLFHVPLLVAGVMTGFIAFGILELQRHGYRRFEVAITGLLGIILFGFLYETLKIGPSASGAAHGLVPHLKGADSLYLAVGIIGATVMPHAIYLHSALTQRRVPVRNDAERARVLRFERLDVIVALGLAGVINMSMLAVAAKLFHGSGHTGVETIQGAHQGFSDLVGGTA